MWYYHFLYPTKIRCLDCHKKFIDNAMISNKIQKNENELLKEIKQDMIHLDLEDTLYL